MSITPSPAYYTAAKAILNGLNATPTATNINLLVAWMGLENGWNATFQCHNPMNTTWKMPGSKAINNVGVQCYPDWATGAQATINTLTQTSPSYGTLVAALRNGDAGQFFSQEGRQELSVWSGGSPSYASTIEQIYHELAPVPASELQASAASGLSLSNGLSELANLFDLKDFAPGKITTTKQAVGLAVMGGIILALLWEGGDNIGF
ncbi:hypothetical protein [Sulfobacillus sp. hq2]|uniref:hypothetical protein n=1 Tax=Sulfobacillus TaxID=28033 RepID=UPI000CD21245|nr:hypothetical protein [Sulfobacillus sp. hq2]POB11436.1 hypothetical protein CO251_04645 [Sulfobacillus sp. hq2]